MKEDTDNYSLGPLAKERMPRTVPVCFFWNLPEEDEAPLPKVEVILYRARDVFDDRFRCLSENEESLTDGDGLKVINLALAQRWVYECDQDGSVSNPKCKESAFMRRVLLKQGTYIYLYRVNGSLTVSGDDKVTKLATKREVNFIDVRSEPQDYCDQDVNDQSSIERSTSANVHLDNINSKIELFRAFSSTKDMYQLNMTVNGDTVSPLERSIWNRVEKAMAARFNNCSE